MLKYAIAILRVLNLSTPFWAACLVGTLLAGIALAQPKPGNPPDATPQQGGVGMQLSIDPQWHVYVVSVSAGGPADKAGVKEGDVLIEVDGGEIGRGPEDTGLRGPVGTEVKFAVTRNGQRLDLTAKRALVDLNEDMVIMPYGVPGTEPPPKPAPPAKSGQKWVWLMTNLLNDESYNSAVALMQRSAKMGYTGIAVFDSKTAKVKFYPDYAARVRQFRKECTAAKMDYIVGVCPMGYANELLANDPNLVEGMPVRDALFVVRQGNLVPDSEGVKLINGSFADVQSGKPVGWQLDSNVALDPDNKFDGKSSVCLNDNQPGGGRFIQEIDVKPWHYYHVSVMVKTQDYLGTDNRIQVLGTDGLALCWQPPPIEKTKDWTRIDSTFNSLGNAKIKLMIGRWGGQGGKIWYADVKFEPGGWVNIIRRDSLPLKIRSIDGKVLYQEGKDFSEAKDAKLGMDPHPGYFTLWHEEPVVKMLVGGRVKEGDKVLVSYHHMNAAGKALQVNCSFSEPKVYQLVEDEIKYLKENAQPDIYFMMDDEIRMLGWEDADAKRGLTCGQLLADNVKKCTDIIERVDPGKPIFVWSDMFDPFHNAKKDVGGRPFIMYLAKGNGPFWESWKGLGPQVGLVNWSGGNKESYENFSKAGHQQILSGSSPEKIYQWLQASGQLPGVVGVMYTTWTGDYGDNLEKYIQAVNKWEKESGGFGKTAPR